MLKSKMKVVVIDRGWTQLIRDCKDLKKSYTKVGFPAEGTPGPAIQRGSGRDDYENISEIALIMFWNEYGTGNIPSRPAIRQAYDANRKELIKIIDFEYKKIVNHKTTVKIALGRIGEWMTGKVRKSIKDLKDPPNAPATIAAKGSDNPLIDTGQAIQSVQHVEVINGNVR